VVYGVVRMPAEDTTSSYQSQVAGSIPPPAYRINVLQTIGCVCHSRTEWQIALPRRSAHASGWPCYLHRG
jgi:hypothetical protein